MMRPLLQGLSGAVLGGAGMLVVLKLVPWPDIELSGAGALVAVLMLPVVFLLIVGCHEAGHLAAAKLARFTPCLFIVGPVKMERNTGGWRIGLNKVFPLSGGLVAATPVGFARLRQRMAILVAGGPSASLMGSVIAIAALRFRPDDAGTVLSGGSAVMFVVTFAFALGSLMAGLIALVPGQGHGFATDGSRILRFLSGGPHVEAEVALLGLIGTSMSGRRPREWDDDLLARSLQLPPDTPYGAAARMMAHHHALDRQDEHAARDHLRTALQHIDALPLMSRPALLLQAAYFAAAHDSDATSARQYFAQAGHGALLSPHAAPLAEGAILLIEENPRAADVLSLARREVAHAIDRGAASLAIDLIARLQGRIEPRVAQATVGKDRSARDFDDIES